jgi:CDP-diacylglycerol--glycerol-3-phosphate 3-phosphatidyltransferase
MSNSRRRHLLINLLTGSRLGLGALVAALTPWSGTRTWAIVLATALVLAIEMTDLADGYLARRHNVVSQFGKVFDPFSDSVARITVFWSLAVIGRCLTFVPLVMAVRDISVAYLRLVMIRRGWDASARFSGKAKALVMGVCALLLTSGPLYWGQAQGAVVIGLSLSVVAVCVISLADYAWVTLRSGRAA